MRISTSVLCLASLLLAAPAMRAYVNQRSTWVKARQDYVMIGQGNNGANYGTYLNTQGPALPGLPRQPVRSPARTPAVRRATRAGTMISSRRIWATGASPLGAISEAPIGDANQDYFISITFRRDDDVSATGRSGGPNYDIQFTPVARS